MAMSRKHYVAVAEAIAEVRWEAKTSAPGEPEVDVNDPQVRGILMGTRDVAVRLARIFADDNPNFYAPSFFASCAITDPENVTGDWRLILDR